jgi:predicted metal-dependent enzyme (double-stranded beta helix superfamily)
VTMQLRFDRNLDLPSLLRLVSGIAADPAAWRPLVNLDADHRHYAQLWRDDRLDVWVISWMNGHDTGFHDHDLSNGAVAIVEGELVEERLAIGGPPRRQRYGAGTSFHFDASHVHRMHQAGSGPAISIHAYSPPLWRMGAYVIEPDGALRRTSISYAEELRPAGTEAA